MAFYDIKPINAKNARYNIIYGERSNGKTYGALLHCMTQTYKKQRQFAYIRRWQEDFTGARGAAIFAPLVEKNEVKKLTGGRWTGIYYYGRCWYYCNYDDTGKRAETSETWFCRAFALSDVEHDKSTSYPLVDFVIFDEFLTRRAYLPDEFIHFMNTLSTILRERDNIKIYMLGNTVNNYCPYFAEMGINHIKQQKQGTIDIYHYTNGLKVAVEYCAATEGGKKSDVYFAFDNPRLQMITGGAWEIDIYPHLPQKYTPRDILFIFCVSFNGDIVQGDIIRGRDGVFIYYHRKTTPIQPKTLTFTAAASPSPYTERDLLHGVSRAAKRISALMYARKAFYQTNEVGEIIRNFCATVKT